MGSEVKHSGVSGMKWGYDHGHPNGKRKAGDQSYRDEDAVRLLNGIEYLSDEFKEWLRKHSKVADSVFSFLETPIDDIIHPKKKKTSGSANELEHYGIVGMKWGVRRYQNEDGSLTSAGRERYNKGEPPKAAQTSNLKQDSPTVKKQKKSIIDKVQDKRTTHRDEYFEKHKKKIMRDPKLFNKYKDKFTTKEIVDANVRFAAEKKLSEFSAADMEGGLKYLNAFVKYSSSGIAAYNNVAKIYNSLVEDEKTLPLVTERDGKKIKSDAKAKKENQEKAAAEAKKNAVQKLFDDAVAKGVSSKTVDDIVQEIKSFNLEEYDKKKGKK